MHSTVPLHAGAGATRAFSEFPSLLSARASSFLPAHNDRWDRAAIWLSALCAAHCLTSAVVVAAIASFGGVLLHPLVHEIGLALAVMLGAVALGVGVVRHGYVLPFAIGSFGLGMMAGALSIPHGTGEIVATLAGVTVLALGHDLNSRAYS